MNQCTERSLNLVYILWRFPVISETFILNEMAYLRKQLPDMNFSVYSIKKTQDTKAHKLAESFMRADIYVPALLNMKFFFSVLVYFISKPVKVFAILFLLIKETPLKISIKLSFYYFLQTLYCLLNGIYFAAKFKNEKIDHLHTHYSESSALIVRIASKLTAIPYSLTMHAHDIYQNPNKMLIVNLIKNSQFSVTISEYNRKFLISLDESVISKVNVVHCGVDLGHFAPKSRQQNEILKLFTVARLVETKGVKETIEACSQIPSEIKFIYNIVGAGPQYRELEELIKETNLQERVKLLGAKTQEEVLQFMQDSDLFLLFCKVAENGNQDGIPVALMEAMAMKMPVISTRVSGIPELIKDGAGVIVEENDKKDYVEKIVEICKLGYEERVEMGVKGRKIIVEEFNMDTEVAKLVKLYTTGILQN